uniref:3',5'-cyclic AMP phosphodiesterase CpdA n=1 Tax=Candidatus Kentrum sp. DK TaxID=2126562 RepID=A0A450S6U0_9GAMM|nr:MAG: 3',5'-cyclic AMP phosphodiesterase CpdA [Candidatus Kentron sp. DK]
MNSTLRWLHLSDFHTGRDDYGQLQLFDSILKHVDQRIKEQGAPDRVFITGDIADRASPEQYDKFAEEFLLPLADRVGEKQILLVPGNHDVDREQQKYFSRDEIRRSAEFFDPTPKGAAEREDLLARFAAYREHCQLLDKDDWLAGEAGCLLHRQEINGIDVGILGLNTAWLTKDKADQGQLTPGKALVEKGLEAISDTKVKIVLGHHPLDWLHPDDRKPIEALFGQHQVLYLHGHMHQNDAGITHGAGNLFLALQSGAAFQAREDEKWVNRLLWAELEPEARELAVEPWKWHKGHQEWKLDFEAFSEQYRQSDRWLLPLPGSLVPQQGKPQTAPAAQPEKKFKEPMGWELLAPESLEKLASPTEEAEILAYFDGRQPVWRLALSPQVPRRAVVERIAESILAAGEADRPGVFLLLGAGGEGKSTAFFQTMERVLRTDGNWRLLHRRGENAALNRAWAEELPREEGRRWLIASDDADQVAEDVYALAFALQSKGRGDVHFLLCARHTEWRSTKVEQRQWENLPGYREEILRGLDEADATAIVAAWERYQDRGLGELAGKSREEAVAALLAASRSEVSEDEGAFLGALLRLRLGDQMKAYVRKLLDRLGEQKILPTKPETLLDAFGYVAAMHAENKPFLSKLVLASALGIEPRELRGKVLWPLGEEAAADISGEMVYTRHRAIAEAAMDILKNTTRYPVEPEELYEDLVVAAEELKQKGHFLIALEKWRFLCDHFFDQGEHSLAIRLARALVRVDTTNSYLRVKLSQLLRKAGQPELALQTFRDAPRPEDHRAFFHEWATAEGNQGNRALNAWLDAVALADATARRPPDNRTTAMCLAGFAIACRELYRSYNTPLFIEGCGAASGLGLALPYLDPKAKRFLSENQAAAREAGVEEFPPAAALKKVKEAAVAAHGQREADLQEWVQPAEEITFKGLESLLGLQDGLP